MSLVYFIYDYVTMLSVAHFMQRPTAAWEGNSILGRMWKEAAVV